MGLRVAVLANLKKNAPSHGDMPKDAWDDLDSDVTINAIVSSLEDCGHRAEFLEGNLSLVETLPRVKPDICFNICEGHWGDSRESQVPAILEMLRIPYTGSKVLALALTLDKPMTKRVLHFQGLPTPAFQVFETVDDPLDDDLTFPLFVKPSREGTGMGVDGDSVVRDTTELRARLRSQLERYRQPILVERYIEGREVTVGTIGNLLPPVAWRMPEDEGALRLREGLRFLPPLEVNFEAYPESEGGVYTNRMKTEWAHEFRYHCPAPLESGLVDRLNRLTAGVFRVTGCLDVARVDFRLDANDGNRPYILEVNPLPGLYPGLSDLVLEAAAEGTSYGQLINQILETACERCGILVK
jgi:D-alanine-D-alanine ligase